MYLCIYIYIYVLISLYCRALAARALAKAIEVLEAIDLYSRGKREHVCVHICVYIYIYIYI